MFRGCKLLLDRLARRRRSMIVSIGLLGLFSSIALTAVRGIPLPEAADEFSYLLAADTFAHGRLTNPPHPLWEHFETVHVLQQPTYASKYPPGQGLVLAVGQWLAGYPIVGVWLSTAAACSAVAWSLAGWLPRRWALFGSLVVALHPVVLGLWGQSYWGGAVALGGGALVTGAVPRILAAPRARDALWMSTGAAVLAISRPFEGAVLTVAAGATLLPRLLFHRGVPLAVIAGQVIAPAAAALFLATSWIGYYNHRVTGDALIMPYALHHQTYEVAPLFIWQTPRPEPVYRHPRLRDEFVGWGLMRSDMARMPLLDSRVYDFDRSSLREFIVSAWRRAKILLFFCAHPELIAAFLLAAPFAVVSDPRFRRALVILGGFGAGLLVTTFLSPHYAAAGVPIAVVTVVLALRHLRLWRWRGWPLGRWIARGVIAVWILTTLLWLLAIASPPAEGYGRARDRLVKRLSRTGERHLLIVRYSPVVRFDVEWPNKPEWVYNGADIDAERVVFAHELNPQADRALVEYFRARRVWLFEPEADPPRLTPYPEAGG
jgi:hypothetical protein